MPTHSGPNPTADNSIVFSYDVGDTSNSYIGEPTVNLLAAAGSDAALERSGNAYPYYAVDINSIVQSNWSAGNNTLTISFEGKRDYSVGGTGGGGDGYPVFYIYFTDWSWAATLGITSYDWSYDKYTFTMPNPSGKYVYFSIYHMNAGNPGKSYSRNHQIEFKNHATQFVNGTRSTTQGLLPLISNTSLDLSNVSFNSNAQIIFDGTDDQINIPTNFGTVSQYTIEYVAYTETTHRMPITSRTTTAFYKYGAYSWRYTHGGVGGEFYHTAGVATGWAHWIITYDGSTIEVFQNGNSLGSTPSSGTADFSDGFKIGHWAAGGSYAWSGPIPIVKIYNTALSTDQVQQNYRQYKSRFNLS
jgi:hypothetical protein